jgi:hypothetical protein
MKNLKINHLKFIGEFSSSFRNCREMSRKFGYIENYSTATCKFPKMFCSHPQARKNLSENSNSRNDNKEIVSMDDRSLTEKAKDITSVSLDEKSINNILYLM